MKKIYLFSLVLVGVALSGCSIITKQCPECEKCPVINQVAEENKEQNQWKVSADNIVYEDANFGFRVTMPSQWDGYSIKSKKTNRIWLNEGYNVSELEFGLPVNLKYSAKDNSLIPEKCDTCFTGVFTLTVYSKEDFYNLREKINADIAKNGETMEHELGRMVGENNKYIFVVPNNIHGQSYDGQFIYDRQTEANTFLSYFETK